MTVTNMKRIPIVVTTTIALLIFAVAIQSSVAEAASSYKVYVRLDNVNNNVGFFDVKVTINGITKTKWSVDTGGQTCPDDVMVACYTNAGAFVFGKTKKGLDLEVCAEHISMHSIQCTDYTTNGKKSQSVSVRVIDLTDEEKTYDEGTYMDPNANYPSQ